MTVRAQEFGSDTRRLAPEDLSRDQLLAIQAIEERLRQAQLTEARVQREGPAKYLAFAEDRHPRVLLLDGDRGTGKTSFMLTLVDRWHPPRSEDAGEHAKREVDFAARASEFDIKLDAAPTHVRVLDIMDFDPVPPGMPLIAALVEGWRPIVEEYDSLWTESVDPESDRFDDLLIDPWHRLFAMAASGWSSERGGKSLVDQVLDREDQVRHWHDLDWHWRELISKVIDRGTTLSQADHRLKNKPVFVIMIDDCDLQVDRVRELLPAVRLLYHPRLFFIVAADRPHMIDMLRLDFLGQQNKLAADGPSLRSRDPGRRDWAKSLAEASFEKVFPFRNRFELRKLSLSDLLEFQVTGHSFKSILSDLKQIRPHPSKFDNLDDYLRLMAGTASDPIELPRVWTHRTAHQIGEDVIGRAIDAEKSSMGLSKVASGSSEEAQPLAPSALEAIGRLLARNEYIELVRILPASDSAQPAGDSEQPAAEADQQENIGTSGRLEFLQQAKMEAYFIPELDEDLTQSAKIILSAQPHIRYFDGPPSPGGQARGGDARDQVRKTSAILAVSLQDDGFPVETPRIQWDARLALVWTSIDLFDHDLALAWPWYRHPSPLRLLNWTKDWRDFLPILRQKTEKKPDRIAFAWIYYQLKWMTDEDLGRSLDPLPTPMATDLKPNDWEDLLKVDEIRSPEDAHGQWRARTLPLLARPEIGLDPGIQERLLSELTDEQKEWLRNQRRQLITDAIITASERRAKSPPEDANRAETVEKIIERADIRHKEINQTTDTPWNAATGDKPHGRAGEAAKVEHP